MFTKDALDRYMTTLERKRYILYLLLLQVATAKCAITGGFLHSFVLLLQTIPPIAKTSPHSPPHEHELTSLSKEESQLTSSRSNSGPHSPRNAAVGRVRGKKTLEIVLLLTY